MKEVRSGRAAAIRLENICELFISKLISILLNKCVWHTLDEPPQLIVAV